MPESPLADFGSVGGGAGCEVARSVRGAGRPARPIKRKCSAGGAGGCGDSRGARAARRPAAKTGRGNSRKKAPPLPCCSKIPDLAPKCKVPQLFTEILQTLYGRLVSGGGVFPV